MEAAANEALRAECESLKRKVATLTKKLNAITECTAAALRHVCSECGENWSDDEFHEQSTSCVQCGRAFCLDPKGRCGLACHDCDAPLHHDCVYNADADVLCRQCYRRRSKKPRGRTTSPGGAAPQAFVDLTTTETLDAE